MYTIEKKKENVILVGIDTENRGESILDELSALTETASAKEAGRLIQRRESAHPAYYVGKGKAEEIKSMLKDTGASGIICDDELTSPQMKNLERILDTKIMDRTMLILDIFAYRALSSEGKVQVELAQLKYRLAHLTGIGAALSRLGGGIGTRGPGETKLETDRRHIRNRISELNNALKEIKIHRQVIRKNREKKNLPAVSLVGYTNAGKSTVMNLISNAGILAEDKLFATLDTAARKVKLSGGTEILLTDTVGFIHKLPHHLIQAFRGTLEELAYSDMLIHVVDGSHENREKQMKVVYETLESLGLKNKPILTVYNKMDKSGFFPLPKDIRAVKQEQVCALNERYKETLLSAIESVIQTLRNPIKIIIPYSDSSQFSNIYGACEILEEEHRPEGAYFKIYADKELMSRLKKYRVTDNEYI